MPTVTAVIPVYNGAAYIRQAVDSALAQRDVDLQIIVIDDGSTDDTWELLEAYGDRLHKVRQANAGQIHARNRGASLAAGEWIAFLDADDEWLPEKLATQLAAADERTGMVYTDCANFGDVSRVAPTLSDSVTLHEGDILEPLLLGNFIVNSSVMIRKSWFDRLGGYSADLGVCEDWNLWLRFADQGGIASLCREPLTRYCWRADSLSRNQDVNRNGRLEVLRRALQLPRVRQLPPAIRRRALANAWKCSACQAAGTEPWKAAAWYLRAAWHWPWDRSVYKGIVKCGLRIA